MALREVDAIGDAIIATEKEIAGSAWGQEDDEDAGEAGDRSLEEIGTGLEGQHEADDDDDAGGDDADGDDDTGAEGEDDEDGEGAAAPGAGKGETKPAPRSEQPEGRVPPGRYREAAERARAAEAERDALKAQLEKATGDTRSTTEKLDQLARELAELRRGPVQQQQPPAAPAEPKAAPDIFEDPKGFVEHLTGQFQTELSKRDRQLQETRVETSMAIAHAFHKDTFEKAFEAINKLDPRNPDDRATVQRIYAAPNPGEALVGWHKRNETLARVGNDPAAFEERIRTETREALLKDPEFRKQLFADLRGEAAAGDHGVPRTTTRLPRSLNRVPGSNLSGERIDPRAVEDSEQAVADAAWR